MKQKKKKKKESTGGKESKGALDCCRRKMLDLIYDTDLAVVLSSSSQKLEKLSSIDKTGSSYYIYYTIQLSEVGGRGDIISRGGGV